MFLLKEWIITTKSIGLLLLLLLLLLSIYYFVDAEIVTVPIK